jgi:cell filamentation protein
MVGRYDAVGPEGEFQPGSRGRVLRNRLGIKSVRELEREESERLLATTQRTIDETRVDQCFTAGDVRQMHQRWLGEIHEWAGDTER